jgi:hypothetical protein
MMRISGHCCPEVFICPIDKAPDLSGEPATPQDRKTTNPTLHKKTNKQWHSLQDLLREAAMLAENLKQSGDQSDIVV